MKIVLQEKHESEIYKAKENVSSCQIWKRIVGLCSIRKMKEKSYAPNNKKNIEINLSYPNINCKITL